MFKSDILWKFYCQLWTSFNFKDLISLSKIDAEHGDVLHRREARWLSREPVLICFYTSRLDTKVPMNEKGKVTVQLNNKKYY
jgi:hypothetical protein